MTTNVTNQVAYLRTSRLFPTELNDLAFEVDRSYIDVANAVNSRIIGIFTTKKPAITGQTWFLDTSEKRQGLRQVYFFSDTSDIEIGFKLESIDRIVQLYGIFTDSAGTSIYGLIPGTSTAIAGQVSFYLDTDAGSTTTDLIKFVSGAGAPTLADGTIVIEWLAMP